MRQDRSRRLAALWFANVAGYSTLGTTDEDQALALVDELESLAEIAASDHAGRSVRRMGEAVLATFDSVEMALKAASALRDSFPSEDPSRQTDNAQLRIGVHLGEVSEGRSGDVLGEAVNIAALLESIAEPGQILMSESVYLQIHQRHAFAAEPRGSHVLKDMEMPMRVFMLSRPVHAQDRQQLSCDGHPRGQNTTVQEFIDHQADLYLAGDVDGLIRCTRAARAIHGDIPEFWNHEGVALSDLGQYREALDCFERAIELARESVEPWCNKGRALRKLGRPEEAILCYDKAIQYAPHEVIPYVNKGNCLLEDLNRTAEAVECYNRVLSFNPRDQASKDSFDAARQQLLRINRMRNAGSQPPDPDQP